MRQSGVESGMMRRVGTRRKMRCTKNGSNILCGIGKKRDSEDAFSRQRSRRDEGAQIAGVRHLFGAIERLLSAAFFDLHFQVGRLNGLVFGRDDFHFEAARAQQFQNFPRRFHGTRDETGPRHTLARNAIQLKTVIGGTKIAAWKFSGATLTTAKPVAGSLVYRNLARSRADKMQLEVCKNLQLWRYLSFPQRTRTGRPAFVVFSRNRPGGNTRSLDCMNSASRTSCLLGMTVLLRLPDRCWLARTGQVAVNPALSHRARTRTGHRGGFSGRRTMSARSGSTQRPTRPAAGWSAPGRPW